MNIPEDLKYTNEHEWLRIEDGTGIIGVTDYAQGELGDVVFVELPKIGLVFKQNDSIGTIEAVKTVADIYAPIGGEVLEINTLLGDSPDLINSDPYGKGWMLKIKIARAEELENLMNADEYRNHIAAG
jgi:glycine cleavage system H protein